MQTPSHGVVLAPVSPAVAALLHQLQAEVLKGIEDANDGRTVPPGATILLPHSAPSHQSYHENNAHGARIVTCHFKDGGYTMLRNWRASTEHPSLHPALWYGEEKRLDDRGGRWERSLPAHVQDDFGTLVPAEA